MTTFSELEEIADDELQPDATRRIAGALAEAILDWPTYDLTSLSAFIGELKREVGVVLSAANIRAKLDSYPFVDEADVWKVTSLNGLLYAWDNSDVDVVLEELVRRIGLDVCAMAKRSRCRSTISRSTTAPTRLFQSNQPRSS